VPVPDRILDQLDELKPTAVRLVLLMIKKAYRWDEDGQQWKTSGRYWTRSDLEKIGQGAGMSGEAIRSAAKDLGSRGWLVIDEGEQGRAHGYRWRLGVPQERFTQIPAVLLRAHASVSHSALVLLLAVYRATWGHTRQGGTEHRDRAQLSNSDLNQRTGLSAPTIRKAARELADANAIERRRPHRGAAPLYRPRLSFLRDHLQRSLTPASRGENQNKHTQPRRTGGCPRETMEKRREGSSVVSTREIKGLSRSDLSGWRRKAFDYWTEEVGIYEYTTLRLLQSRSAEVHRRTAAAYERGEIGEPGGARVALEEGWFAPRTRISRSGRKNRSGGTKPLAQAFAGLMDQREGWEWEGGSARGDQPHLESKGDRRVGLTHAEYSEAMHALPEHPGDVVTIDQKGPGKPRFVPTKRLAQWAHAFGPELEDQEARRWAQTLAETRQRYEAIRKDK